jgi:hypothetical protein
LPAASRFEGPLLTGKLVLRKCLKMRRPTTKLNSTSLGALRAKTTEKQQPIKNGPVLSSYRCGFQDRNRTFLTGLSGKRLEIDDKLQETET